MLTNDSIDVFMLQKLQAKQARYLEAMRKGADVIDISDINAQELKTAIITNPETRANIEIEIQQKKIENEKNKFLADSAFVLRKYEEYTKEKEKVTHAELTYSRIEGYANEGDEKSDYWINQLPHYQRMIDLAKIDLEKVAQKLIEKGVNVTEIEKQTEISEAKIEKLEFQIENLPQLREELVSQYRLEKEESLRIAENCDYVREREMENTELFKNKYLDKVVSNKEENIVGGESKSYSSRKR
ncbi:hypothetical protein [Chryseobacterium sp.]|uniref:hypothetical protein n=1 Tax=Chryseobacterium sp. TaxID=1871047 RepID=UPI0031D38FD7